ATTLGRNGSDYTASILGAALDADAVEIWTDVDGILTADPRIVPDAWVIDEISFQEAMELSFFGAEVIHPYTLIPVIEKNMPVFIKNTLNPSAPGTRIAKTAAPNNRPITGIASIDDISMITIEGGGMVGMPGIASRIFASMARTGANIIMITQASSEHSICLVCRREEAAIAAEGLEIDLSDILNSGIIRSIRLTNGLEIVAVIGDNMQGQLGLSGKLFSALGNAGVNILAIAQGSTELNISFVIKGEDKQQAIKAIHRTFFAHRQPEK
ncbi:MAG: aspartate kinase, partial [Spirochaetaceae bacterium]|nr:aspartate kinase [Spirochaetaceae bacterium]